MKISCPLMAIAMASLAGCAGISSPRPATELPDCGVELQPNASCVARVQADQVFTSTGLNVKSGEAYEVKVAPKQVWYDLDRVNDKPPAGEPGNALMNRFKHLRRHDTPWFTLMGAVTDPALEHARGCSQDLSRHDVVHAQHDGVLALYPNDALPRIFYMNNRGHIWVFIRNVSAEGRAQVAGTCH